MTGEIIGRVMENQEGDPLKLTFATRSPRATRIGEFVYYKHKGQEVLCRITDRSNMFNAPTEYYLDEEIEIDSLLDFTGEDQRRLEEFKVSAKIIGSLDIKSGFRSPRNPPKVGAKIHLAENEFLATAINKKPLLLNTDKKTPGGLNMGHLLDRGDDVPINLDANSILSTHLAILAATGQGKSYTTGVLLEEMLSEHNRTPCIVFDMHGEYSTLTEVSEKLRTPDYQPRAEVIDIREIGIPIKELQRYDMEGLLPELSEAMSAVFGDAYSKWRRRGRHTKEDLADILNEMEADENSKHHPASIRALYNRLKESLFNAKYITNGDGEELKRFATPGKCAILDLGGLSSRQQVGVTNIIMKLLLKGRQQTRTGKTEPGDYFYVPSPVLLVVEEAHRIAPASGGSSVLATIMGEGRKFGIGAIVVSQRPGKISSDVLSQCLNQIISRITNPVDQEHIRTSAEGASNDLLRLLPSLCTGEAVVFGHCTRTPVLIRVRQRITTHGGDHGDPIDHIRKAWEEDQLVQKEAVTIATKPKRDTLMGDI